MKPLDREAFETFTEESAARFSRIEKDLDALIKKQPVNPETVHSLFRDTHSLKGAANLLGLRPVEKLAHKLEDILDLLRQGKGTPDEQLVMILRTGYARIGQFIKNTQIMQIVDVDKDIATIEQHFSAWRSSHQA
jgi:two-component system chemotaxis sensor kinase CheA